MVRISHMAVVLTSHFANDGGKSNKNQDFHQFIFIPETRKETFQNVLSKPVLLC
jgi:hypothetical protein